MKKNLLLMSILLVSLIFVLGCQQQDQADIEKEDKNENAGNEAEQVDIEAKKAELPSPVVTMTMENDDIVTIELYPAIAPTTVNNFVTLVDEGFYDGLIFHRVIPDFMIQGGDPQGNGTGGPGYHIFGEFSSNGFTNDLIHKEGVISMARSGEPNSAGSQFFIMVDEAPHLDGDYAAFGQVIDGIDVVHDIVKVERGDGDKPLEDQVIKSMTVDLNGYEVGEIEKY